MGEIAEMMIDGDMCQFCGEYLGDGDGYPRSCEYCYDPHPTLKERKKKEKKGA